MLRMGETWSRAINLKLDIKQRRKDLEEALRNIKMPEADIQQQVQRQIWTPARHTKQILRTRHPVGTTAEEKKIVAFLSPILGAYPVDYTFEDDSLYLDVKMHPDRHVKAFIMLNQCLAAADHRCIQSLPLQHSWVYGHAPMNTIILVNHILKRSYSLVTAKNPKKTTNKQAVSDDEQAMSDNEQAKSNDEQAPSTDEEYWAEVVDLNLRVFKDHPRHVFNKYITTDGVSLCVVRQTVEKMVAKKVAGEKRKRKKQEQAQQAWMPTVSPAQQAWMPTVTPAQQAWMPMAIPAQQAWMPMAIPAQQAWMPTVTPAQQPWMPVVTPVPQDWVPVQPVQPVKPVKQQRKKTDCLYIDELSQEQLRGTVGRCVLVDPGRRDLLFAMHEDSTIQKKQVYRYTKCQQRVETKQTKYRKILEHVKKASSAGIAALERTLGAGSCIKPDLDQFKVYLAARAEVAARLTAFYNETMSHQQDGATTPKVPLHRKLRLSTYIKRQQADQRLVKQLRTKFKPKESDPEPIFIMGNWSAPMTRFHEPIRGKGWRTLLKRGGFDVYLIDEYLTSKICPNCYGRLSNTHDVLNPRPWMRRKRLMVKCHGLLSCQSEECLKFEGNYLGDVKRKLWNRDLVGVLNFRHILQSLRETGTVPTRFQRGQPTKASKPRKARKTTARKPGKAPTAPLNPT
ncbi:hypothetical protein GGH18_000352 [Coemansia sp. RSA 530]|nr:hypothetical protein GGH18_000352 [Coemansia sp. RSA 530]